MRSCQVQERRSRRALRAAVVVGSSLLLAVGGCGDAGPRETVGTSSFAITFPNDQPAFDYFVGKGLTPFQAAGIVGNLDQESGVDPTAVESGGGPGRGIAQWSVGGRWDTDASDNATWYAGKQGESLLSLPLQLDFIWYELTTFSSYGLAALQATTNVTDATVVFQDDFEGCGACDQTQRVAYAENVLAAFGPTSGDAGHGVDAAGPGADSGVGTPCTVTTTGESGVCMDTAACAALGDHVSTAGYCPGPADVECCTAASAHPLDAATDATRRDSGVTGGVVDATAPRGVADGGTSSGDAGARAASSGGCAVPPGGPSGAGGLWLAAAAWMATRRRRRG